MTSRTEMLREEYLHRTGHKPDEFAYFWPDGRPYKNQRGLKRIASLAIPPAYTDVYVSPDADADLQGFGRDSAGRLQYRYHPDFVQERAMKKWQRLARFAAALPEYKHLSTSDLRRSGLCDRKVMALMTRLLYMAYFRVGSKRYTKKHRSYGLTTLRQNHVKISGQRVVFDFRGKHGVPQHHEVSDRTVAGNLGKLKDLPGPWLFQAVDDGQRYRILARDLNGYVRDIMGPFSAKDFRTWGGTLTAAEYLAEVGPVDDEAQTRKNIVACVKSVSTELGNTPAVVRQHYICPVIFDLYRDGKVLDDFEPRTSRNKSSDALSRSEQALKRMLEAPH